jgi:hypothetical protein
MRLRGLNSDQPELANLGKDVKVPMLGIGGVAFLSSYGFLHTPEHRTPLTVQLELSDGELVVTRSDWTERLPLRVLRKIKDDGAQIQVGRRGDRKWKLNTSGVIARELRSAISGRTRRLKWGAARTWHALVLWSCSPWWS